MREDTDMFADVQPWIHAGCPDARVNGNQCKLKKTKSSAVLGMGRAGFYNLTCSFYWERMDKKKEIKNRALKSDQCWWTLSDLTASCSSSPSSPLSHHHHLFSITIISSPSSSSPLPHHHHLFSTIISSPPSSSSLPHHHLFSILLITFSPPSSLLRRHHLFSILIIYSPPPSSSLLHHHLFSILLNSSPPSLFHPPPHLFSTLQEPSCHQVAAQTNVITLGHSVQFVILCVWWLFDQWLFNWWLYPYWTVNSLRTETVVSFTPCCSPSAGQSAWCMINKCLLNK